MHPYVDYYDSIGKMIGRQSLDEVQPQELSRPMRRGGWLRWLVSPLEPHEASGTDPCTEMSLHHGDMDTVCVP